MTSQQQEKGLSSMSYTDTSYHYSEYSNALQYDRVRQGTEHDTMFKQVINQ